MNLIIKKFIIIIALTAFCSNIFAIQHLAPTSNVKLTNALISNNNNQKNQTGKSSRFSFIKSKFKFAGAALIILALFTGCATINPHTGTIFDPGSISQNGKTYRIEQTGKTTLLEKPPPRRLINLSTEKENGIISSVEFLKKGWLIDAVFDDHKVSSDYLNMALGEGGIINLTNNFSAPRIKFNNKLYTNKRLIAEIFNKENGKQTLKALYATLLGFYLQDGELVEIEVFGNYNDVTPLKTIKLLTSIVENKEITLYIRKMAFSMLHNLHYLQFLDYFLDKNPNHNIYKELSPYFKTFSNLAGESIIALFKPNGLIGKNDEIRDFIKPAYFKLYPFNQRAQKIRKKEKYTTKINLFTNSIINGKPSQILRNVMKEDFLGPIIIMMGGYQTSA